MIKEANSEPAEMRGKTLIAELEEKIERYARVSHYVLITGERGTGKDDDCPQASRAKLAREKEFVNLNCASLTPELLESELFGYEKGAFTGATAPKAGLFEIASGGTIFLDEIGEIPVSLQAKLLKAVEEKRIRRVGGSGEKTIDARVIAATSQNLGQMVESGRFRADLYDRLNILNLETVPLRHQKEKIKHLLLDRLNAEQLIVGRAAMYEISGEAVRAIEDYDWRGNFRELINFATRLAVECFDDAVITAESVRKVFQREQGVGIVAAKSNSAEQSEATGGAGKTFDEFSITSNLVTVTFDPEFDDLDTVYLKAVGSVVRHVVGEHNGNMRSAAQALGVNHSTVSRILGKFNRTFAHKPFSHAPQTGERTFRHRRVKTARAKVLLTTLPERGENYIQPKIMSEKENTKKAAGKDEDWAILPFDEAEDEARWAKLSGAMDELIEKTESTEKLTGTILMEEDLSRFVSEKSQSKNAEADDDELF